jgi:hypothetical protein
LCRRLLFANHYKDYDFKRVVFSDEKMFRFKCGWRTGVWRKRGEQYKAQYCIKTTQKSKGIMVWAAMNSKGEVVVKLCPKKMSAAGYQEVLSDALGFIKSQRYKPSILHNNSDPIHSPRSTNKKWLFQQDGAAVHRAKTTGRWLRLKGVKQFNAGDWPAQSPDLNPIEHLWPCVTRSLQGHIYTSRNSLWEDVKAAFAAIPPAFVQKLYLSMPARMAAVIEANGSHTKY